MATEKSFVEFIVDQLENAGHITYRAMFGEYGIYSDGKLFGLICDNKLFVKITDAGKIFAGNIQESPAYPGAKPSFLIEEQLEDREWLTTFVNITRDALPEPKIKKPRKK
jgi:TfoX/Sxy family transcriptional regulator of competence genes